MSVPAKDAFAGYRFHKVLGDGEAGIFEASESSSGETVVIESLIGNDGADADLREWFAWAWEALEGVDHPNLPRVREVGSAGESPFAVRDPIDGVPLPELLAGDERLDPTSMRVLICRLADGLHRAHEAGVIHGALGAEDVVVDPEARGGATGRWVGFGRAEGLRRDDVRALGEILDGLLRAERRTRPDEEPAEEEGPTMDEAILAMLSRVANSAQRGEFRTAGELRDEVAAGTEEPRGWRRVRSFLRPSGRDG